MIYLILLGITFLIQLFAASWYCLAKSNKLNNVFRYKMLCSGIYIADTLLCGAMANVFGNIFYISVLLGMAISFTGDIFEDKLKTGTKTFLLLRSVSSLVFFFGICYEAYKQFGLNVFVRKESIIALICVSVVFIFLLLKDKSVKALKLLPVFCSLLFFAAALVTGIAAQLTGEPNMQTFSCVLIMSSGAVFFSDYLYFGKNKEPKLLLRTNLYYFGLMIFSCSSASI